MKKIYQYALSIACAVVSGCNEANHHDGPSADLRNALNGCIELHSAHGNPLFASDEEKSVVDEFDQVSFIVFREAGSYRVELGNSVVIPDGNHMGCSVALATNRVFALDYYIGGDEKIIRLFEPDSHDGVSGELPESESEQAPDVHRYSIGDFQLVDLH